ncbi:hypothetical protein [Actinoplanes sp. NPDC051494]|uniref:hypothetical protein n=1 Tax=Actinoplanes sp. NPDC051494 TaxID=3363907 RepID=UPI0037940315
MSLQPPEPQSQSQSQQDTTARDQLRNLPRTEDLVPQEVVTKDAMRVWMAEQERREKLVLQGQVMGLISLSMMLMTVVVLAVLGYAWVAAILAGTSLVAIVSAFITAQYVPAPMPPRLPRPRRNPDTAEESTGSPGSEAENNDATTENPDDPGTG